MFDTFVMVDWSGGNDRGKAAKKDAIWMAVARRGGGVEEPEYLRNRAVAEAAIGAVIKAELAAERRVMMGFDFPFGYPRGFAEALCGEPDPMALWDWLEARIEDTPTGNNRFDLAGQINMKLTGGCGPFWGNGLKRDVSGLLRKKGGREPRFAERRAVEELAKSAFTCWQLSGAGAVGSQVLMGLPVLARLRRRFAGEVAVWPFDPVDKAVALVEIWPSLVLPPRKTGDDIPDREQVRGVAARLAALAEADMAEMLDVSAAEEGWILGVLPDGRVSAALSAAESTLVPPRLRDDCFALPPGVDWVPVDAALERLRGAVSSVTGVERVAVGKAGGRVLAEVPLAARANPPGPNSAVDGWGFAHGGLPAPDAKGRYELPICEGRAAAGASFAGRVPGGMALRVLTGALLPKGVDTMVLQEDVASDEKRVVFDRAPRPGANARAAGEDVSAGEALLRAGHRLRAPDLALLAAVGLPEVTVRQKLRVGVLSTGDEIVEPGAAEGPHHTHDANRPMLLELLRGWGHEAVDLGCVGDNRAAVRAALDEAVVDAVITSGGASAGDEDHLSALLREEGKLTAWRIALKPGRPLALAQWSGMPVFGLPGNPVAALVCAAIFARPALEVLAGGVWLEPEGFAVPAGFAKQKKPGRREYLRARLKEGRVEVFRSEGSGRISGLAWAGGLVELGDEATDIAPGDLVRFIPYGALGIT
ncbi:molybdopterin-binding protein [Vannielia sp.]|uniref:molybdopterin-binding protein n=1 Tax=Vannielia sp. TaxID=2813045 RepID=UPI00261E2B04|nr:molybdopterin-binding protein [Vannielia sp.]MDF1873860.1 molybdopterin-binding protein [Vannielia sp.]